MFARLGFIASTSRSCITLPSYSPEQEVGVRSRSINPYVLRPSTIFADVQTAATVSRRVFPAVFASGRPDSVRWQPAGWSTRASRKPIIRDRAAQFRTLSQSPFNKLLRKFIKLLHGLVEAILD